MSTEILAELENQEVEVEKKNDAPLEKVAEVIEEVQIDPIVEKASKTGWTNKEAWVEAGKDPDEWVDAAEFVRRKPLFDRLHKQEKALKDKDARIEAISKHAAKVAEMTRKKTIAELEAKRDQAVEVGDVDAFKKADKELKEVEQEYTPEPAKQEQEIPVEVQEFAKKHEKWFEKDEDMTDYAIARAKKYADQGLALKDSLPKVEEDVRRAFSHKFTNPNKEKPAAVGANSGERRPKTYGYNDLDAEQKQIWASVKATGMKLEKFIAECKALEN